MASAYLSCTIWFLRTLVWKNEIPHTKLGKRIVFDKVDLDRYVDQLKQVA